MIKKEEVIRNFSKEERDEVVKIYEWMELAYEKEIPLFSRSFCTPNIWLYFVNNFNTKNFKVEANGYFEESDRRVLSFNNIYGSDYPYKLIKIEKKSKFDSLSHRDYLGSIMALGMEREKFGDLRVYENYAVVPVYEDVVEYVISSLNSVGKSPVSCEVIYDTTLSKVNFLEVIINVSSLRLDSIVSKLSNISRSKALDLINQNKILVDYCKVNSKSLEVKEGQRITIAGVGKYIMGSIVGNTKSGRFKVNIKKYI